MLCRCAGNAHHNTTRRVRATQAYLFGNHCTYAFVALTRGTNNVFHSAGSISRVGTNTVQFASPGTYQFIIVTISSKFEAADGGHTNSARFSVDVNGQRLEIITNSLTVTKGGSSGHYWGYQTYAVSQKMLTYGVFAGNSVRVNFVDGNLHISSDIRVDLTN